jgi:hypothetical protein
VLAGTCVGVGGTNTLERGVPTLGACEEILEGVKVAEVGSIRDCSLGIVSSLNESGSGCACGSPENPGGTDGVEEREGNSMLSATSASTDMDAS